MSAWKKKTFCLITGASKGLGRCIAIEFSKNVSEGSVFVLIARDADGLSKAKSLVESVSNGVTVVTRSVDLEKCNPEIFEEIITKSVEESQSKTGHFDSAIVVHNAGSLGDITKTVVQMESNQELHAYYHLNVFSVLFLNTEFFKYFTEQKCNERIVINISSLAAIQPFNGWGLYCSGKFINVSPGSGAEIKYIKVNCLN